jgi:outer membrane immunogenic protein
MHPRSRRYSISYGGAEVSNNTTITPTGGSSCPSGNLFCSVGSESKTLVGWTIGGGVESMIAARWTAKVEYLL